MIKVKHEDLDKLGLLYERYKKKLFGFFYNLGNNPLVNDGNILVKGVNGEIILENVSGSASADTLNGDLDITFPGSLKANVKAKSDMGEIFTDFDMSVAEN